MWSYTRYSSSLLHLVRIVCLGSCLAGCTDTKVADSAATTAAAWSGSGPAAPKFFVDPEPDAVDPVAETLTENGSHEHQEGESDQGMSSMEVDQRIEALRRDPLGGCRIDLARKRVEVQAVTLFEHGPFLEFLACTERGKDHESLFLSFCSPDKLHLACLSLGMAPGDGPEFFGDPRPIVGAPRVAITVEWQIPGQPPVRWQAEDLLFDRHRGEAMARVGFSFTGSRFLTLPAGYDGPTERQIYAALYMGSVIAVFHDPDAVLNTPLESGGSDTTYVPYQERLPARFTPCRLIIEPWDSNIHGPGADPNKRTDLQSTVPSAARPRLRWVVGPGIGGPAAAAIRGQPEAR